MNKSFSYANRLCIPFHLDEPDECYIVPSMRKIVLNLINHFLLIISASKVSPSSFVLSLKKDGYWRFVETKKKQAKNIYSTQIVKTIEVQ